MTHETPPPYSQSFAAVTRYADEAVPASDATYEHARNQCETTLRYGTRGWYNTPRLSTVVDPVTGKTYTVECRVHVDRYQVILRHESYAW